MPSLFWTLHPAPCRSTFLFINTNWSLLLEDAGLYTGAAPGPQAPAPQKSERAQVSEFAAATLAARGSPHRL